MGLEVVYSTKRKRKINPAKRNPAASRRGNPATSPMVHAYAVIWKDVSKGTWHTVALTMNKADATEVAQLLADRNKEQYGVQARFVHQKDFEVY